MAIFDDLFGTCDFFEGKIHPPFGNSRANDLSDSLIYSSPYLREILDAANKAREEWGRRAKPLDTEAPIHGVVIDTYAIKDEPKKIERKKEGGNNASTR